MRGRGGRGGSEGGYSPCPMEIQCPKVAVIVRSSLWQENGLNEDRVAQSLIPEFSLNVGFSVEIRKCPAPQLGLQPEGPHARAAAPRQLRMQES